MTWSGAQPRMQLSLCDGCRMHMHRRRWEPVPFHVVVWQISGSGGGGSGGSGRQRQVVELYSFNTDVSHLINSCDCCPPLSIGHVQQVWECAERHRPRPPAARRLQPQKSLRFPSLRGPTKVRLQREAAKMRYDSMLGRSPRRSWAGAEGASARTYGFPEAASTREHARLLTTVAGKRV